MSITELKKYLSDLVSHVTFEYDGYNCGIDPFSADMYEVWCGDFGVTANSIDEVMNGAFFNGNSLIDIWDDVINVEY